MEALSLEKYGITGVTEIVHNPSYEALFEAEMDPSLEGYEKGQLTELGAVNVMTGIYTGRSPKDKFIVMDENSARTPCGGPPPSSRTTTSPLREDAWSALLRSLAHEGAVRQEAVRGRWTSSAAPTTTPAWPSASSWRWLGRPTSSRTCSSSPPLRKNWPPSSPTSWSYNASKAARWRTTRSWACTPSTCAAIFNLTSQASRSS